MITQHVRAFFLSLSVLLSHKSPGRVIFRVSRFLVGIGIQFSNTE